MAPREVWKDVPGYEGMYQVSNTGRVKSLDRKTTCKYRPTIKGRELSKINTSNGGYKKVFLWKNNKGKGIQIHRLVLLAFKGPSELETRHLDGNPLNNHLDNLKYGTPKENASDQRRHGTYAPPPKLRGEEITNCKFTNMIVRRIREYLNVGFSIRRLAKDFNTSQVTIINIKHRRTWSHI